MELTIMQLGKRGVVPNRGEWKPSGNAALDAVNFVSGCARL
jgi:hypothetical protein